MTRRYRILNRALPLAMPYVVPGVLVPIGLATGWVIHSFQQVIFKRRARRYKGKLPPIPPESVRQGEGKLSEIAPKLGLSEFKPFQIDGYLATNLRSTVDIAPMYLDTVPRLRGRVFAYPAPFTETVIPGYEGVPLSAVLGLHPPKIPRPALIVVHGLLASKYNDLVRIPALKAFYEWGFNVCAVDLRMFGRTANLSSLPNSGGGLEARDILAVARYLRSFTGRVTSVGLLGFSLGGATVINAAGASGEPVEELIDGGVMAVCPPLAFERTIERLDHAPDEVDYLPTYHFFKLLMDRAVASSSFMKWVNKKAAAQGVDTHIVTFDDFLRKLVAWGYIGVKNQRHDYDPDRLFNLLMRVTHPTRALSRLRVPTLLLAAKDDPLARLTDDDREMLLRVAANNPNLFFHETDRGGHCGHNLVAPRWFYRVVRRYFSYWARWKGKVTPFGKDEDA